MQVLGSTDDHRVQRGFFQHLFVICIFFGGSEGRIFIQLFAVQVADGPQACAVGFQGSAEGRPASRRAYNTHIDFLQNRHGESSQSKQSTKKLDLGKN